jgi:outer membrane protein W
MIRFYALIIMVLAFTVTYSQPRKKTGSSANYSQNPYAHFLQKQWWLGLKAGTNLVNIDPVKRYSAISPSNYPVSETDKVYGDFNKTGSQVTFEVTFYYKQFGISFQPAYRHSRFTYTNAYEWSDAENVNNRLTLNYYQDQKVDHAELPLIFKYDILGNRLRPYVQLGAFYSFLINANKSVEISGVDYASGGINPFTNEPVNVGAEDLFASNHWGLLGGVGANYNLGNVRLNLDIQYRMGMSLINSTENRYGNDRLSGIAEAMDDIKMNSITISVGCLFPMRFLASGFKTLDQR